MKAETNLTYIPIFFATVKETPYVRDGELILSPVDHLPTEETSWWTNTNTHKNLAALILYKDLEEIETVLHSILITKNHKAKLQNFSTVSIYSFFPLSFSAKKM